MLPAHPRAARQLRDFAAVRVIPPAGYLDFVALQASARIVLTDSGGVQEETTVLGIPCLTLRDNTERPITLTEGTNQLVAGIRAIVKPRSASSTLRRRVVPRPCGRPRRTAHRGGTGG